MKGVKNLKGRKPVKSMNHLKDIKHACTHGDSFRLIKKIVISSD